MRQNEQRAAFVGDLFQLLGIGKIRGQRLVANDMNAALQEFLGRIIMHMVRRDDRHRLDAVLQLRLADGHLAVAGIGPPRIEAEIASRLHGLFRRRR